MIPQQPRLLSGFHAAEHFLLHQQHVADVAQQLFPARPGRDRSNCLNTTKIVFSPQNHPDAFGVAVGAFGDPTSPQPEQSVFTTHSHPWLGLPGDMRTFDTMPRVEPQGAERRYLLGEVRRDAHYGAVLTDSSPNIIAGSGLAEQFDNPVGPAGSPGDACGAGLSTPSGSRRLSVDISRIRGRDLN